MAEPLAHVADDRLIVSLDFGTTFSGVAYVYNVPDKKPDVVAILEWPGELVPPLTLAFLSCIRQYPLHASHDRVIVDT